MKLLSSLIQASLLSAAFALLPNTSFAASCELTTFFTGNEEGLRLLNELAKLKLETERQATLGKLQIASSLKASYQRLTLNLRNLLSNDFDHLSINAELESLIASRARELQEGISTVQSTKKLQREAIRSNEDHTLWDKRRVSATMPTAVSFDKNGTAYIASYTTQVTKVSFDKHNNPMPHQLKSVGSVNGGWVEYMAVSPNGKTLGIASAGSIVLIGRILEDTIYYDQVPKGSSSTRSLIANPDNKTFFVGGRGMKKISVDQHDLHIQLINTDEIGKNNPGDDILYDRQSNHLYIIGDQILSSVDLNQNELIANPIELPELEEHSEFFSHGSHQNGKSVFMFHDTRGISILEISDSSRKVTLIPERETPDNVNDFHLTPDGKYLIVIGDYPDFQIFDLESSDSKLKVHRVSILNEFPEKSPTRAAISADGNRLALFRQRHDDVVFMNLKAIIREMESREKLQEEKKK